MTEMGKVASLWRYPVKSMLGEALQSVALTSDGVEGDRVAAVIDSATGMVATAKHPYLWRGLLQLAGRWIDGAPQVSFPDGTSLPIGEAGTRVSDLMRRSVRLSVEPPDGAVVGRPAPEDVIAQGDDADVPYETLEIGAGSAGRTFVDDAPIHLVTTATLAQVGVEVIRYRPNLVLDLPGSQPFCENDWPGHDIAVGPVVLRVLRPTPRCAVPTLAHGTLPRDTDAVRILMQHNRIPEIGMKPCLGAYAQVLVPGTVASGDTASLSKR